MSDQSIKLDINQGETFDIRTRDAFGGALDEVARLLQSVSAGLGSGARAEEATSSRLLVVASNGLLREAVCALLRSPVLAASVRAVDRAQTVETLPAGETRLLDLVVYCLPERDAPQERVTREVAALDRLTGGVPVLLLGDDAAPETIEAARGLGARGYLDAAAAPRLIAHVVGLLKAGGEYFTLAPLTAGEAAPARAGAAAQEGALTPRERQVLACLGRGFQNKIIAFELGMCESTVKVHVRNILKKLDVRSRTQAALHARDLLRGNPGRLIGC